MIEASAPTERRITCVATGHEKLLVEVLPTALSVWCRICKRAEPVPRAQIERMWAELDQQKRESELTDCGMSVSASHHS